MIRVTLQSTVQDVLLFEKQLNGKSLYTQDGTEAKFNDEIGYWGDPVDNKPSTIYDLLYVYKELSTVKPHQVGDEYSIYGCHPSLPDGTIILSSGNITTWVKQFNNNVLQPVWSAGIETDELQYMQFTSGTIVFIPPKRVYSLTLSSSTNYNYKKEVR